MIDINGTHWQGNITAWYWDLVRVFGKPDTFDGYKVDAHWVVQEGDVIATVYNYKDGINYLGRKDGTPKTRITDWHIGGFDKRAVDLVYRRVSKAMVR